MTGRKMSLLKIWRSRKERAEQIVRASQLRLHPSQQKRLLGDSGVRAALQNSRVSSLLPPVGTEVFRRLTPASLEEIQRRHEAEETERKKRKEDKEVAKKEKPKPARDLEAGKPLPFFYGQPPPELLNTPLEELDPFYQSQKTFLVLGKENMIHRFNAESSCFLLSPSNPLRTVAIKILIHHLFSLFILLTLVTFCGFMAVSDPPPWMYIVWYVVAAVVSVEVVIKVVSRGFCVGKFTFLRDPWNWLDLIFITTLFLSEFIDLDKFVALGPAAVMLKIIPVIPGMKATVAAFVQSVKRLAGVLVLMAFGLCVLALIGQQIFMGSLRQKCVIMPGSNRTEMMDYMMDSDNQTGNEEFNYHTYMNRTENYYHRPYELDALRCGNSSDAGTCPEGYTCVRWGNNPNYGFTNWDSFGWSLLSMFRLMTQDFWENFMMLLLRTAGKSHFASFLLVFFPGSFVLVSLFLAVVAMATNEQEEAVVTAAKQKEEEFKQIMDALKKREEQELQPSEDQPVETQQDVSSITDDHSCCPTCCLVFLKWNCCGCWRGLKRRLRAVVMNPFFDLVIAVCLILNTVFMAMEHYPMTMTFEEHLSVSNLVFTAIFFAEMVIKLLALDPSGYFKVSWHVFESVIVLLSLMELSFADIEGLSVLRAFRLLRVFRLARWWPSFHGFLWIIWASLRHLTLLLIIIIFFFSVVGMKLFKRDYKDCVCRIAADCQLPRWHMADFFHSFLVIFRVLSGQWVEILWDCMEVSGQATCLIFFMTLVFIGNLLVLNVFLTLLLSWFNFFPTEEKQRNNVQSAAIQIMDQIRTWLGKKSLNPDHTVVNSKGDKGNQYLALNVVMSDQQVSDVKAPSGNHGNQTSNNGNAESQRVPIATAEVDIEFKTPENEDEKKGDDVQKHPADDDDHKGNAPDDCCCHECYRCCPFLDIDTSQGAGRVWSNVRRACLTIVQHKYFDIFIIIIIALSTIAMMFEDVYLLQRGTFQQIVETADQVFTFVFLLEMLLKWIAFGLKKYFTDAWCWLDFLVLDVFLVSLTANMVGHSGLGTIRALGTLRALGPLRALSRFQGMKLVVEVLVRSVPALVDSLLVVLTVWLVFSVVGVNMFAGKFYYCFNETSEESFLPEQVNNKTECLELIMQNFTEVRWKNLKLNYDNVVNGYLSLFHLAASEDWMDIVYAAEDARMVEDQPVYKNNPLIFLFFIIFIIVGSFFTFNFILRLFINNLQRNKIRGRHVFMTAQQQKDTEAMKKRFSRIPQKPAHRPQTPCRAQLFDLVTSMYFEVVMVVIICLNMLILMVETMDQSFQAEEILHWFYFTFILIFLIEFILKISAFGRHYFSDSWNVLDFVVLLITIIGLFLSDLVEKYFISPSLFNVLRLARVVRILSLIRYARGIQKLLLAIVGSLPALFNITSVLLVLMVTFSLLGMFNFAHVKKGAAIDDMFNFETFWSSLICVSMISTSGGWGGLLLPMLDTPPDCDPYMEHPGTTVRGDCGNKTAAIIFFLSFLVLSFMLVVQLYLTVILETFSSEDKETLRDEDLQGFYKTWRKFDPNDSRFISYSDLSEFCDALQDPLRIPKPNSIRLIHMDLPLFPGDKVHCVDVFRTLTAQVLGESTEIDSLTARLEDKFMSNSSKALGEPISSTLRRKQEEVAVTVIQRAYRKTRHGDADKTAPEAGSAH